jgi:hypothetical protein
VWYSSTTIVLRHSPKFKYPEPFLQRVKRAVWFCGDFFLLLKCIWYFALFPFFAMTLDSNVPQVLGDDEISSNYLRSDRIAHAPSPSPEEHAVNAVHASMNSNSHTCFTSEEIEELKQLLSERYHQSSARQMPRSTGAGGYVHEVEVMHDFECSQLLRDTFSFIIAARTWSFPFLTGMAVVVTKIGIYSLILADMASIGSPGNPLGISAMLEWPVAFCQTIAVAGRLNLHHLSRLFKVLVPMTLALRSASRSKSRLFHKTI